MSQNNFFELLLQQKSIIRVYTQVILRAFWHMPRNFPAFWTSLKFGFFGLSRAQKVRLYLSGSYSENQNQFDYNIPMYR